MVSCFSRELTDWMTLPWMPAAAAALFAAAIAGAIWWPWTGQLKQAVKPLLSPFKLRTIFLLFDQAGKAGASSSSTNWHLLPREPQDSPRTGQTRGAAQPHHRLGSRKERLWHGPVCHWQPWGSSQQIAPGCPFVSGLSGTRLEVKGKCMRGKKRKPANRWNRAKPQPSGLQSHHSARAGSSARIAGHICASAGASPSHLEHEINPSASRPRGCPTAWVQHVYIKQT